LFIDDSNHSREINTLKYKIIDHTADIGIKVFGSSPPDLFENAATAMFDMMTDLSKVEGKKKMSIKATGDDWSDLIINFLRELLYLFSAKDMVIRKADINHLTETSLDAQIAYDIFNPDTHEILNEIKAVTYHQLKVEREQNHWSAQIIFDI
jgi:SHS2 domain-containing protein